MSEHPFISVLLVRLLREKLEEERRELERARQQVVLERKAFEATRQRLVSWESKEYDSKTRVACLEHFLRKYPEPAIPDGEN